MRTIAAFACLLVVLSLCAGSAQARPAKSEQSLQGPGRKLLKAIDVPWGLPASQNASRYRDVAANVGDTVTIHWNHTAGGPFSLWKIPTDTCPANYSTSASGFSQLVSLHSAATVTLRMTTPGVIVFTSSGPGQCAAGVLVNIVVSKGLIVPTDIEVAVNVTAPGPVPAPAPAARKGYL